MRCTEVEVAVVGGGPAGLAAAASLQKLGRRPVVLEADAEIGARWARRYDRLSLHTVRRFSGLPYHAMSRAYPKYVPKDRFAAYLREYADRFGLDVRLAREVTRIRADNGAWLLETAEDEWRAAAVVVATGKHGRKRLPQSPGLETFRGALVHSDDYRSGRAFSGRRALVIGIGNSGAEIATDLVEHGAAAVEIAVRTAPPIARRDIFGVPVQVFGILLSPLPPRPVDRVGALVRRLGTGDLARYGIGPAAWGPFEARRPPVIDVGFLDALKRGAVSVRPAVERFTERGVLFGDGSSGEYDVVVAATGFTTGLDTLLDVPAAVDARGLPASDTQEGLYFVGFNESARGALFEINRDARRIARRVDAYLERAA